MPPIEYNTQLTTTKKTDDKEDDGLKQKKKKKKKDKKEKKENEDGKKNDDEEEEEQTLEKVGLYDEKLQCVFLSRNFRKVFLEQNVRLRLMPFIATN